MDNKTCCCLIFLVTVLLLATFVFLFLHFVKDSDASPDNPFNVIFHQFIPLSEHEAIVYWVPFSDKTFVFKHSETGELVGEGVNSAFIKIEGVFKKNITLLVTRKENNGKI